MHQAETRLQRDCDAQVERFRGFSTSKLSGSRVGVSVAAVQVWGAGDARAGPRRAIATGAVAAAG